MQVRTKKGERYTGGVYHFTLEISRGNFDIRELRGGLSRIVCSIDAKYFIVCGSRIDTNSLYLCREGVIDIPDLFGNPNENVAAIHFLREKGSKFFDVNVKARKHMLSQKDYNTIDSFMEAMFGKFKRINSYEQSFANNNTNRESQQSHSQE